LVTEGVDWARTLAKETTMTQVKIRVGQVGFGVVNDYPPTHWRFGGKLNGAWVLHHVKHPSQARAYPAQFVDWATVERIMAG
jgi:hypothetical protein